ncbi:sugar-binding domain-containing protein [Streptomyces sp. NPDC057557]|uniref:sugar-binding domain-containing protein n=1 Tax=Streptomyces sp. NPDC057557 TaxID=3346167 RepID=UPI0036CDF62C
MPTSQASTARSGPRRSLPPTMRLERKHPSVYDVFAGIGWYRRYFRLDPRDGGRRLSVVFDGVQTDCIVYLNGEKVAEHQGRYMGFVVDITGKVRFDGDNVLAVRVSNLDEPLTPPGKPRTQLGYLTFGGIYRGVTLRMTNRVHISDPLQEDLVAGGGVFVLPYVSRHRHDDPAGPQPPFGDPVGDLSRRDPLPAVVGQGGRIRRARRDAGRPDVHLGGLRDLGRRARRRLQGRQHRRLGSRAERALPDPRVGRLGGPPAAPTGRSARARLWTKSSLASVT